MNDLRLRFLDSPLPDLVIGPGSHPLLLEDDGPQVPGEGNGPPLILRSDRRGLWLTREPHAQTVHVNGRPIRRLAMLRPGDRLHVGGQAIQLVAGAGAVVHGHPDDAPPPDASRLVLRALGGAHHGRAWPLDRDVAIGAGDEAQVPIDGATTILGRVRARGRQVLAEACAGAPALQVNGQALASASLQPGDQLLIGGQRLLLEAPSSTWLAPPAPPAATPAPASPAPARRRLRLPWLLLAALLLAAALAALLLFGG